MKRFPFLMALILTAVSMVFAQGNKPPKTSSDTPATTTIKTTDENGSFFNIQSDQLGSYRSGVDSVQSIIQGIGDWEMDAKASGIRRVYIDFSDPVIPGDSSAPFTFAFVPTRFISKCLDSGIKMQNFILNQTVNCPLAISITYGSNTYAVRMNANYSGTEPVSWTCLAVGSGKCISWKMIPGVVQPNGQRKIRGQLIKIGTNHRNPDQILGQFYFAFEINVTTP